MIKPILNSNQTAYLKNLNDYNIKENYVKINDRYINFFMKNKRSDFDIVKNEKKNLQPREVNLDKRTHFYEGNFLKQGKKNNTIFLIFFFKIIQGKINNFF